MKSPLDEFLKVHKRTCTIYIFSGDKHCSCGRDLAIEELRLLRAGLLEVQKPQAIIRPKPLMHERKPTAIPSKDGRHMPYKRTETKGQSHPSRRKPPLSKITD